MALTTLLTFLLLHLVLLPRPTSAWVREQKASAGWLGDTSDPLLVRGGDTTGSSPNPKFAVDLRKSWAVNECFVDDNSTQTVVEYDAEKPLL